MNDWSWCSDCKMYSEKGGACYSCKIKSLESSNAALKADGAEAHQAVKAALSQRDEAFAELAKIRGERDFFSRESLTFAMQIDRDGAEISKLKAELEENKKGANFFREVADDRLKIMETLKSRAAKYKEALEKILKCNVHVDLKCGRCIEVAQEALKEEA